MALSPNPSLNVATSPVLSSLGSPRRGIVVFSGGSAANSLVDVFSSVAEARSCGLTYVIPISDNGGSSSELIRVFGGPGIGDIRSMCCSLLGLRDELSEFKTTRPRMAIGLRMVVITI